ncbi:hypothetical protein [Acinetobacter sp. ANC 3832]|uniref:hypothetical protein n=1 Tax=Acinetobacter sp. ANC 3832 TaxID=1977874 RepID=UPI001BB46BAE|nr:hypothetical protein [Acinetobacter sp. ANC 3832]
MAEFHHGISKKEPTSGIIPMRDADTNVIGLIAFSDDADEDFFALDTPTLVTSINRALAASGTEGNLRTTLEAMSAITSPTLVVVRIADPFKGEVLNQSLVIGTTLDNGQRTGIQALLTAKSILGITPKITIAPDVETPDVVQELAAINKKLRAFSYVTPRDVNGVMLETMQEVTAYRDTLSHREIMLIWPEFTSGNIFLGKSPSLPSDIAGSGFRIRLTKNISKSPLLHTYNPESVGTNGEKVVNLANLFDTTETFNGVTTWSRALSFEDVNYPSSNGGVTIVFNTDENPNYWVDMTGITTLMQFFTVLSNQMVIEFSNNP